MSKGIYRIYGEVKNQFVGFIHPDNIKGDDNNEEALKLAKTVLEPRGIKATTAISCENVEVETKRLDSSVTFLYKDHCVFDLENCAGFPSIIIKDDSEDESFKGFGFNDVEVAEELIEKLQRVVEYLREKTTSEATSKN